MNSPLQIENYQPPEKSRHPVSGFLSEIVVDHGPAELLGPFFVQAEEQARQRGVQLSFAPLDALREANEQNRDSWRPLIPIFDSRHGGFNSETGFCILGRNSAGDIVATQAARLYRFDDATFYDSIASMELLYSNPSDYQARGERWHVEDDAITATKAISGATAFSGASWYRPDFRGRFLSTVLPRISRSLAYTRWNTKFTTSMMAEGVVKGGFAQKCGYTNIAWQIRTEQSALGDVRFAFVWMTADQLLADLRDFSDSTFTKIDAGVDRRTA
jgi:hypothetical protein